MAGNPEVVTPVADKEVAKSALSATFQQYLSANSFYALKLAGRLTDLADGGIQLTDPGEEDFTFRARLLVGHDFLEIVVRKDSLRLNPEGQEFCLVEGTGLRINDVQSGESVNGGKALIVEFNLGGKFPILGISKRDDLGAEGHLVRVSYSPEGKRDQCLPGLNF